jgi:hypothetical protein
MALDRRDMLVATGALLGGATGATSGAVSGRTMGAAGRTDHETTDGYGPLGSVSVPGAREAAVAGEVAYVAATDGFAVVDITDPTEPSVLAERRDIETDTEQALLGIWDLWPWEDRLAVVGPGQYSPNLPNGVALFDVSDPADPEQVAFYPTESHIHNTYFEDGIVYLTGRDPGMSVVMVDVTGDDPVEVGRWSPLDEDERWSQVEPPLRSLHDVYVQNGTAYLPYWDAGTWIVDVSDPADPSALGRVADYTFEQLAAVPREQAFIVARTPGGADHYAQVNEDGSVLLVGRESWAIDDQTGVVGEAGRRVGGAGGIDLYDVSDPANPEQLSTIEPPDSFDQTTGGWFTTSHNADIRDGRLYTSWYFGGVALFDVSDPANPAELARWQAPREASFWTAQAADGCYVASSARLSDVFGGLNDTREALYTFPDEAGSQADPPSLTDWPEDLYGQEPENRPEVDRLGASVSQVVDVSGEEPDEPADGTGSDDGANDNGGESSDDGAPDDGSGDDSSGDDGSGDDSSGDDGSGDDGTPNDGSGDDGNGDDDTGAGGEDGTGPGLGIGAALAGLGGYLFARRAGRLSDSRGE